MGVGAGMGVSPLAANIPQGLQLSSPPERKGGPGPGRPPLLGPASPPPHAFLCCSETGREEAGEARRRIELLL